MAGRFMLLPAPAQPKPALWRRALAAVGLRRFLPPQPSVRTVWAGAESGRLMDFVSNGLMSAPQETRGEIVTLRSRARELARNNPYARRYLALVVENVLGHKGIQLQVQTRYLTGANAGQLDQVTNGTIESAWKDWGKAGTCEVRGRYSWTDVERLMAEGRARDGEAFLKLIPYYNNTFGFAVQLIDPDMVDETHYVLQLPDGGRIWQGVEMDRYGKPVAYHVLTAHPNDTGGIRERERIPAELMVHWFKPYRPDQVRGVTDFAPVMGTLNHLGRYTEAAVVNARVGASKMGFIQLDENAQSNNPDEIEQAGQPTSEVAPGIVERLGIGETFVGFDPKYPDGEYGPFTAVMLRECAAGLNVSYMSLTGDLNGTSYSSGRIGSLQERDRYRVEQQSLYTVLHDRVYRLWLKMALLRALKLPEVSASKYERVVWRPRGWDWVDPEKDGNANRANVAAGFESPQAIVAEMGRELEDVYEEIAEAQKLATKYGLQINYGVSAPTTTATPESKQPNSAAPTDGAPDRAVVRLHPYSNGRTA